jgi:hypothetical protein
LRRIRHHLLEFDFFLDTIKPWFLTEEKLAAVLIKPSSWGSQVIYTITHRHSKDFFGAVAGEKEDFCKGSFTRTSFTLF